MSIESIKDELGNIEDRVEFWLEQRASIDNSIDHLYAQREEIEHTLEELAELADTKEAELGQDIHRVS